MTDVDVTVQVQGDVVVKAISDIWMNRLAIAALANVLPRKRRDAFISGMEACAKGAITLRDRDSVDTLADTLVREALPKSLEQIVQMIQNQRDGVDRVLEEAQEQGVEHLSDAETIDLLVRSLGGIEAIRRALEAGQTVSWNMPSEGSS